MARIPRAIYDFLVAHALSDTRNEVCGVVHGRDGIPVGVHPIDNVATPAEGNRPARPSPYRYEMNGLQQGRFERIRDMTGESLFAIYHSHVASRAYPSPTDIRQAFYPAAKDAQDYDRVPAYPDAYYILLSLPPLLGNSEALPAGEEKPVRAFRIRIGGVVEEEPIEVV